MTQSEFSSRRQAAIESMRQMNKRSVYKTQAPEKEQPPKQDKKPTPQSTPVKNGFNMPIISEILKDGDTTLIIGLLLLLLNENCDKTLIFALIYILW